MCCCDLCKIFWKNYFVELLHTTTSETSAKGARFMMIDLGQSFRLFEDSQVIVFSDVVNVRRIPDLCLKLYFSIWF